MENANDILIFDLDGTIANTEKYHWIAHNQVVDKFEIHFDDDDVRRYVGRNDMQIYDMICADYNLDIDKDKAIQEKIDAFIALAKQHNLQPYKNILEIIQTSTLDKYILTSQNSTILNFLIDKWNLRQYFKKIISIDKTNLSKLDVIKNFAQQNFRPTIYEDSPRVIFELNDAGYDCIAVLGPFNRDELKDYPNWIDPR
ncbi:MAG: HAD family hydrolase [Coriobacteriales bacterium]|nr:HAD family hydrolase [Coriobacteriales bacterium]